MTPVIAVIIPCRNEEKYIGKCLDSIVASAYPHTHLQVWVADGMSTDSTRIILQEYTARYTWVHMVDNPDHTTPFAFNLGIQHAQGADILITLGAHAEVFPDFFDKVNEAFAVSPDIGCVGGVIQNEYENETSRIIGLSMSSQFGVGNAHFRTGSKEGYVDTVGFPAYKREVFEKTGLFNTALTRNQDDEFNYRVVQAGYKIYLSPRIRSKYYVRGSFQKLARQYYQYGYWKVYVNKLHKTITTGRQLVPPAFVVFLVVGLILACCSWFLAGLYAGVLAVYLAGAVYFATRISTGPRQLMGVVWCFLILHCSYGYGYIRGIIDFNILGRNPSQKAQTLSR